MTEPVKAVNDNNRFNYKVVTGAIKRLTEILLQEIEHLKANNPEEMIKTHKEKVDIVQFLETQNETLKQYPEVMQNLSDQQREDYKKLAQELQKVLNDNNKELTKARTFNEEVIKLVADAVADKGNPVSNYNEIGKRSTASIKKDPPSVTINEKI